MCANLAQPRWEPRPRSELVGKSLKNNYLIGIYLQQYEARYKEPFSTAQCIYLISTNEQVINSNNVSSNRSLDSIQALLYDAKESYTT